METRSPRLLHRNRRIATAAVRAGNHRSDSDTSRKEQGAYISIVFALRATLAGIQMPTPANAMTVRTRNHSIRDHSRISAAEKERWGTFTLRDRRRGNGKWCEKKDVSCCDVVRLFFGGYGPFSALSLLLVYLSTDTIHRGIPCTLPHTRTVLSWQRCFRLLLDRVFCPLASVRRLI